MRNKILVGLAIAVLVIWGGYQLLLNQFAVKFGESYAGEGSYNFQINQISFIHPGRLSDSVIYKLKNVFQQEKTLRPDTAFLKTIREITLQNDKLWPKDSLLFMRTKDFPSYMFYLSWNKDQSGIQVQQIYYLNDAGQIVQHEKNPNSASEMNKQIQSVNEVLITIVDTIQ